MSLNDIGSIFNRALNMTFSLRKILLIFVILLLCGLMVVFFRGVATNAGEWLVMSLTFLPIFLCSGVLLSAGVIVIRIYHDEIKGKDTQLREILSKSWEIVIGASYFAIPIILIYMLLWILMGIFFLFRGMPLFGDFFSVIFAFGPFLINLGSIILAYLNIFLLFFITPVLALKGLNGMQISKSLTGRLKYDVFLNMVLLLIALLPISFVMGTLSLAGYMTGSVCYSCEEPLYNALRWFFIMIPFVAILSPAVVFFFNFSAEAHAFIHKKLKEPK